MIKQLGNSSSGSDGVHNRCLKNFTKSLINHLTILFKLIINTGYIPHQWKRANIVLLLKSHQEKLQPASYRPISLLSCLGKLPEKTVKRTLMEERNRRRILPIHQASFRTGKSPMYDAIRLERRRQAAVIFFYIKAMFNSVWHEGFIDEICDLKLLDYLLRYIVSFLDRRTACIETENSLSALVAAPEFFVRSGAALLISQWPIMSNEKSVHIYLFVHEFQCNICKKLFQCVHKNQALSIWTGGSQQWFSAIIFCVYSDL